MRQTTLCVPLEVKPESCSHLATLIDAIKQCQDRGADPQTPNFDRLIGLVPSLHFMSMSVFPASDYDPLFILEANFDGPPGPFWGQLEAVLGADLRAILRCCKRPLDDDAALFDAVSAPGSHVPVAPYLEARTQHPSVFHHGNRGLDCARIRSEHALFRAVRDELDARRDGPGGHYHSLAAPALHAALRAAILPGHGWLDTPAPERITPAETVVDWARMFAFVVVAMLGLSAPGLAIAALLPWRSFLLLMIAVVLALSWAIYLGRRGRPGTEITTHFRLSGFLLEWPWLIAIVAAVYVAVISLVADPFVAFASQMLHVIGAGPALGLRAVFWPTARAVALSLVGLVFLTVPLLLLFLRRGEMRDSSQDSPQVDERMLREMLRREDWVAQNHMGSLVLIKPGILRTIVIHAGHLGLGLALRIVARDGYLGSMRTVHFAHWAFLNNSSRLLFLSNFDHSWGSYLDDFIEKAHGGLTLAWGSGVGFPPTRFLIYDGASHGRQFKAWALASRAVSRFWYSAYPDLTVDQVERNNRIANGLRKHGLDDKEARAWMLDL